MLWLICFLVYAIIVGLIAKLVHPGPEPVGCLSTIIIGIVGSYTGGFINFIFGRGEFLQTSGIVMGIVGGVIALCIWRWWNLKKQNRSFWSGNLK
jgi:uncharacterized membrane protein YeaQ/YmgE (transglycosylase-associated protein family)